MIACATKFLSVFRKLFLLLFFLPRYGQFNRRPNIMIENTSAWNRLLLFYTIMLDFLCAFRNCPRYRFQPPPVTHSRTYMRPTQK